MTSRALARTPRVITALMLREMTTSYGRSPGGYAWLILEPVAGVAVLTLAFSFIMRSPPIGASFPLFYATGLLPFSIFMDAMGKTGGAVQYSRQLLTYPVVTFMDALLARFILNGLIQGLVFVLVMLGIFLFTDTRTLIDWPTAVLAFALTLGLGFSLGTFNCLVFAFYPLYQRLWSIVTRPLLIISGIFFTYENLPESLQHYLWYNPVMQVIALMRRGFYTDYPAPYVSVPYILLWISIPSVIGLYFLRRYHRVILHEL